MIPRIIFGTMLVILLPGHASSGGIAKDNKECTRQAVVIYCFTAYRNHRKTLNKSKNALNNDNSVIPQTDERLDLIDRSQAKHDKIYK
jgi:hypothetical protein